MKPRARLRVAVGLLLGAGLLPGSAPLALASPQRLPWSVRVEVFYGKEKNRTEYPEELERRIVRHVLACEAFRSVGAEGTEDLVARFVIDKFELTEEKSFRGPMTGGPGEFLKLGASVEFTGDLSVTTGGETVILPPRRLHHVSTGTPQFEGDDPVPRALAAAYEQAVGWADRYLCRQRENLRTAVEKSGVTLPESAKPQAPSAAPGTAPAVPSPE